MYLPQCIPVHHGFPMVFPWFSHGFPMVFPRWSVAFSMAVAWSASGTRPRPGSRPWSVASSRGSGIGGAWRPPSGSRPGKGGKGWDSGDVQQILIQEVQVWKRSTADYTHNHTHNTYIYIIIYIYVYIYIIIEYYIYIYICMYIYIYIYSNKCLMIQWYVYVDGQVSSTKINYWLGFQCAVIM